MAIFAETVGGFSTTFSHRKFRADPRRKRSRGVADVIGTILLLGITVVLFGAVFFFVNAFPTPPPQPTGQFSASVTYSTNGKQITMISIVHLAGPLLQQSTQIWLGSQAHPAKFPSYETLSLGLKGSSQWAIGQTWIDNVTALGLTTPDNITVNIIANNQLVFHTVVPGSQFTTAPQFVQAGTVPAPVPVNGAFELFVQINDANLNTNSVYANLSQLPGAPGLAFEKLNFTPSTGTYECIVRGAWTSAPGTFYAFVNSTDKGGLTNSIAVPVQIGSGGGGGGGSNGQLVLQLGINNSAPVLNSPIKLVATVTNLGSSPGTGVVNWTVPAAGSPATLPQSSISVSAGGTTSVLSGSWTPTSASDVGPHTFTARASVGLGTVTATLNITIFPRILFISQNLPALPATLTSTNGSAYIANALEAAGFPFSTLVVPCATSLTAAQMSGYGVVIINFGTNTTSTCIASGLGANELTGITGAYTAGSSIWIVGANFWASNPCLKTGWTTFAADFGLSNVGTCAALVTTLPASPTANFAAVGNLLANGTDSPYAVTSTINGFGNFNAYGKLSTILSTANPWLTLTGANKIGLEASAAQRTAILTLDPMMLVDGAAGGGPASSGIGAAGSEVVYNVVNFLAGLSSSSNGGSTGRATVDYAVSEVLVVGTVHGSPTTVWAGIRSNAATAGIISVALYVNGAPALQNGVPVTATLIIPKTAGYTTFVSLSWQAPSAGGFTISVIVIGPGDLVSWNNGLPASLLSNPTMFT